MSSSKAHKRAVGAVLARIALGCTVVAGLSLVAASAASAAATPIKVGSPLESGPPSVAVDNTGTALVAWANQQELGGASDFVQYCVIPAGATGCSHDGNLNLGGGVTDIDGVQALSDGATLVILADAFGTPLNEKPHFEPEQEWQSTDGGATWTEVDGGVSVSDGIINADTEPIGAVTLPGTGVLGYGWDTAGPSGPTFNAFPLSAPPECSRVTCPAGFATLEPSSNPDQLGNEPGRFASVPGGPQAGVMGIFETLFTNGPLGCAQDFGTAYVYGSGSQTATNSYNVSPGQPNSAWKVPLTQADCNTEYPAVAGGPSGFGILEDRLSGQTIYHRFDAATRTFDTTPVVVADKDEQQAALSQDGTGAIYGTYLLGGAGGPVTLSYSADGGKTWSSGTLHHNAGGGVGSLTSAVDAPGQGWAAWLDNGSVFAQPFQAADAISAAAVGGTATTTGKTVTVDVSCATFPCTVDIVLTAPETVVVHASSAHPARPARLANNKHNKRNKHKRSKRKTITLGSGRFTLKSKGVHSLAVKLSGPGKRFVRSHKGHVKIDARVTEVLKGHDKVTTRALELRIGRSTGHKR